MHLCHPTEAVMLCMTCRDHENIKIYILNGHEKHKLLLLPVETSGSNEERLMQMTLRDVGRATGTQEYQETITAPSVSDASL